MSLLGVPMVIYKRNFKASSINFGATLEKSLAIDACLAIVLRPTKVPISKM